MKTQIYILILFCAFFVSCGNPLKELEVASTPAELRALWQSHEQLIKDYTAQARDFREVMFARVRALPQHASDPDTRFLRQKLQEQLQQRPVHYNFIVVPDLSMRISREHYPRNFRQDTEVIEMVLDIFLEKVQTRYFGHKDRIVLRPTDLQQVPDFSRYAPALSIDFSGVDVADSRQFIDELPRNKQQFMNAVREMYQEVASNGHRGADIWKFFDEDLDQALVLPSTDSDSIRNVLVLVTDGYLEADKYGAAYCQQNRCEYLSNLRIQKFRRQVLRSGMRWDEYFEARDFGITPVHKPGRLAGLEVICLEFYDRFPKKQPSDYQITRKFWEKWFADMGLRAMVDKTRESPEDTRKRVVQFLEN